MTVEKSKHNLRILVIDDNRAIHEDFRKILMANVKEERLDQARAALFDDPQLLPVHDRFEVDCADRGEAGLVLVQEGRIKKRPFACAFVDMRMPGGWDGLETIERLWREDKEIQVVICTAYSDQPWDEIRARIGFNDKLLILQKPFNGIEVLQLATALCRKWNLAREAAGRLDELNSLVDERTAELQHMNGQLTHTNETLVRTIADLETAQAEILRQHYELERVASRDLLSGCLNRRAFYAEFERVFNERRENDLDLCCLMVDIDNFKQINDRFGHAVGDQAIQAVAICLSTGLRLTDSVGRYGGEEFCLMFPRTRLDEATNLAERIRLVVERDAGNRVRTAACLLITVSCGVSSTASGARSPLELIDQADKALYSAKQSGRNCVMAFDQSISGENGSNHAELQIRRVTPRPSGPEISK